MLNEVLAVRVAGWSILGAAELLGNSVAAIARDSASARAQRPYVSVAIIGVGCRTSIGSLP